MDFDATTTFSRSETVVWRTIEDEGVLLDVSTNFYYSLNPTGLRIWELLETPKSFETLLETVLEEYEVEQIECEKDLKALLGDLADQGLIKSGNNGEQPRA